LSGSIHVGNCYIVVDVAGGTGATVLQVFNSCVNCADGIPFAPPQPSQTPTPSITPSRSATPTPTPTPSATMPIGTEEPADEFGYQYWRVRLDDECGVDGSTEYIVRENIGNEFFFDLGQWYHFVEAPSPLPSNRCYYIMDSLTREEAETAYGGSNIPVVSNLAGPFTCAQCFERL
jgi:hypothetical protein